MNHIRRALDNNALYFQDNCDVITFDVILHAMNKYGYDLVEQAYKEALHNRRPTDNLSARNRFMRILEQKAKEAKAQQ